MKLSRRSTAVSTAGSDEDDDGNDNGDENEALVTGRRRQAVGWMVRWVKHAGVVLRDFVFWLSP
jgi:hypothetical protein